MNTYADATKEGIGDSMNALEGVMFKKSDEEDSYRERVYTKIKKVTQKTTRKYDYKKNSQKKSGADLSS